MSSSSTRISINNFSFNYTANNRTPSNHTTNNRTTSSGLDNIQLHLAPGQCLLLTGDSGCGKSTLLKALSGLVPHFHTGKLEGRVELHEGNATFCPAEQALFHAAEHSASVFQNPRTQFFCDTVEAELAFGLENLGVDPETIEQRITAALRRMKIEHLRHRKLSGLSGGQLQIVACACAFMLPGGLVMLDEPSSNLSPEGITHLADALRTLKSAGKTIVIAEHRLYFLRGIADRVAFLRNGTLTQQWSAEDFYRQSPQQCRALGLRTLYPPELRTPELTAARPTAPHPRPPELPRPDLTAPRLPTRPHARSHNKDTADGLLVRNLRFAYGDAPVLNIGSLHFPTGTVTAITGPNGAGKTTLARILSGLIPKAGSRCTIQLHGTTLSARQRQQVTQMVMQDVGRQLFGATVEEELLLGLNKKQRKELDVDAILSTLDIAQYRHRHPQSLSGGQRQRVAVAAAQAQQAEVYIFDEPTSGVSLKHLQGLGELMHRLARSGAVVIVISHDAEFINSAADRVITMSTINTLESTSDE